MTTEKSNHGAAALYRMIFFWTHWT